MSTDPNVEAEAATITTTDASASRPAVVEPANPLSGPRIYLYTSLSAGSSQAITSQNRIETILKANKVTYEIVDLATDDKAKSVWRWKGKGRKLPGVVRVTEGDATVVGSLEELDEANEYGELKQLVFEGGD